MSEIIIDCDAAPFCPKELAIWEHKKGGQIPWDPAKVNLYVSECQEKKGRTSKKLLKELEGKLVINANVLDFLLAHPELIPESWKSTEVLFWGTIYRTACSNFDLYVRFLYWNGNRWCSSSVCWLDLDWLGDSSSAPRGLAAVYVP